MTLVKQGIDVSFAQGLDTKTDPKRVPTGAFVSLENTIFTKGGLLQKRNGYAQLTSLPDDTYSYLTTLNGNLTAIGTSISAYNTGNSSWVNKGNLQPLTLTTLPIIRNNINQTTCDSTIGPNGSVCTVYTETDGTNTYNKYVIADGVTGQNIVEPTVVPVATGTVTGGMRVFTLGNNFILCFTNDISGTYHLQYIAISCYNPSVATGNADLAASYIPATGLAWDGYVYAENLYVAYYTESGGSTVAITQLSNTLNLASPQVFTPTGVATLFSVCADASTSTIYATYYVPSDSPGDLFTVAVDTNLNILLPPAQSLVLTPVMTNIVSAAQNGVVAIAAEVTNAYGFDSGLPTNYIVGTSLQVTTPFTMTFNSGSTSATLTSALDSDFVDGMYVVDITTPSNLSGGTTMTISGTAITLGTTSAGASASSPGDVCVAYSLNTADTGDVVIRSLGLASKAFIIDEVIYFLGIYESSYQPTYFLVNGTYSTSTTPLVAAKLAYENADGYKTLGLPGVAVDGMVASIAYLYKDLIQAVNKNTNVPAGSQVNGIYSQTGINLVALDFGTQGTDTAEISADLHITGGFLWMYDGYVPVEHNFFLYPDTDIANPTDTAAWSDSGGSMAAKPDGSTNTNAYYYQFTYEWTDNQGNAFRSAPSIPVAVTTSGSGTSGSVTLNIPTLRVTMKTANPVKVVVYRWSVNQQNYYQTTSISAPTLNNPTIDYVTFVDTNADATILGNNLLYTTGGVVEDINAPASSILSLFDTRLWLVDAEDPNVLWYSKQCIEATPVEMSDLFTIYVPPTTATAGSTGPITGLSPMDDKLVIFKENALFYINGAGPDNTGANNQYSPTTFITSTVGCTNQRSIVLMTQGLMFQSGKGIWLCDRSLGVSYIGAPVEAFTMGATVTSAVNVPETNQVRFTLDSGITVMYDYYYSVWSTFTISAVSSCAFQNLHTFINADGNAYQESPGESLDGSVPVCMQFKTGPLRLGDLQNYQRAYFFYLLGTYFTPHILAISLFYDYSETAQETVMLYPANFSAVYGEQVGPYGQGGYGGYGNLEQFRVFLSQQRCQAVAIGVQEIYDPSYATPAGQGLTLSGINILLGFKDKKPTIPAALSFG